VRWMPVAISAVVLWKADLVVGASGFFFLYVCVREI
jgi:hypothetical protein